MTHIRWAPTNPERFRWPSPRRATSPKHGCPEHPRDLPPFDCIGWRATPNTAPYRREFDEDGQSFSVQVDPQITTNDPRFMLRSALAHAGITFAFEETFRVHVDRGELVSILEAYLESFPGFFLYSRPAAIWPPSYAPSSTISARHSGARPEDGP